MDVSETGWQYPPSKSTILRVYSYLVYSADQRRYFGMGDDLFRSHMTEICTPVLTHWFLDSRWRYYSLLLCYYAAPFVAHLQFKFIQLITSSFPSVNNPLHFLGVPLHRSPSPIATTPPSSKCCTLHPVLSSSHSWPTFPHIDTARLSFSSLFLVHHLSDIRGSQRSVPCTSEPLPSATLHSNRLMVRPSHIHTGSGAY